MVNPVMDDCTKTLNPRKIVRNQKKTTTYWNQKNTKTEVQVIVGFRFSHLACRGGGNSPLTPRLLLHWLWYIVFTHVSCPTQLLQDYELVA